MRTALGCTRCGSAIQPGQRFCSECGTPVVTECASCGAPVTPEARFCPRCGVPVTVRSGPSTPAYGATSTPPAVSASGTPDTAADSARHTSWRHVAAHLQAALRGEFTIEREIGRGGMAAVYLARELRLDRWVALKVMSPSLLAGHGMVERFRQEAVTVANLSHANIVTIHSVRDVDDLHCFVMQFVDGRALDRILHEVRRLPLPAVQSALFQVGSALSYAHRRGVIHRDIKPANILIDTNGDAIVTDFGIAKVAEASSHTQTGVLIGTPSYMSPEQCLGVRVTAASDQYALGIVAYELLGGQLPFTGPSLVVLQAQISQAPTPLEELAPDCPPEVAAAVMRMLAKDPADRFPSIAQAVAAIGGGPLAEDDPLRTTLAVMAGAVPPTPPVPVPGSVQVSLPEGRWEVGDELQATAAVSATDGQPMAETAVQWTSADPSVLAVDAESGRVTLLAPGRAVIRATAGDAHGEATLEVEAPRPESIAVDAPPAPLRACETWRPVVTVRDRRGATMDVPVTVTVDDADVAVATDDGAIEAIDAGRTRVHVAAGALTHELSLVVAPAAVDSVELTAPDASLEVGDRSHLSARALDRRGRPVADAPVSWRSSAPEVATVNREGVVSALAPGHASIRADAAGSHVTTALEVRPAAVASVALSSPMESLHLGERARLTAVVRDRHGTALDRALHWSTRDERVLTVTPDGTIEARGLGIGIVTVECEGHYASVEVGVMVSSVTELFPPPKSPAPAPEPTPIAPLVAPPERTPEPPTVPFEIPAAVAPSVAPMLGSAPVETTPVDVASLAPPSVEPAPVEPAPVEPVPADAETIDDETAEHATVEEANVEEGTVAEAAADDAATADAPVVPVPPVVVPAEPAPRPTSKLDVTQFQVIPRAVPREDTPVAAAPVVMPARAPVAPPPDTPDTPPPPPQPAVPALAPPRAPSRAPSPRVIGAGVAAAVVALVAWWLASGDPEQPGDASSPSSQTVAATDSAPPATADSPVVAASPPPPVAATAPPPAPPVSPPRDDAPTPKAKDEPLAKSAAETRREEEARRREEARREADARREAEARRAADSARRAAAAPTPVIERPVAVSTLPATSAPAPAPAPPPRPATGETTLINPAITNEWRTGMQRAISAYVGAIGARSMGDLQRAFPSMPSNIRRGWETMFSAVDRIEAQASGVQVTPVDGENGSGELSLSVTYNNPANKRPCTQVTRIRVRLARSGAAWQIAGIEQLGSSSSAGCRA